MTAEAPFFQPKMLGFRFFFEESDQEAMVTDETIDQIYIESPHFTGWWSKASFWESWGIED